MVGGCINIWRLSELSDLWKRVLSNYENFINTFSNNFSIKINYLEIKSEYEKFQIKDAIGSLPVQEVVVCGWANVIFPAAEEILRTFGGGYLKLGVGATEKEFRELKGEWYCIEEENDNPEDDSIHSYHLIDWRFTRSYFNNNVPKEDWGLFSMHNIEWG